MADFKPIYDKYQKIEGSYSNDPDDRGGETWCGIARNFHPKWEGWEIVDSYKNVYSARQNLVDALKINPMLEMLVCNFYKKEFFDAFNGDGLPQKIAAEIYDIATNAGLSTAIKYLQRMINILNRNEDPRFYQDINVDGNFGDATYKALLLCIQKNTERRVFNVLNIFQGFHYITCMENNEVYEKYIGWFDRIEIDN
jgi:lysozyme family protein